MHTELQAFFDEHAAPTHAGLNQISAQCVPILAFVGRARQQMLHYQNLLHQAELAPHDRRLDGKLEMMHQTINHAQAQLDALTRQARDLVKDFAQLDRYAGEWKAEIEAFEAANG